MSQPDYEAMLASWRAMVAKKNLKDRRAQFETSSQIPVEPFYGPGGAPDLEADLNVPGRFPFTRGVQPTMYRGRLWTMRMYAGFGSAEESNGRYKQLIANGGTGLSVAFDLPTQMGLDSDDPRSRGEVGKAGVAIDSIADMRVLFDGIDLANVSTSMTINSTAAILLALYVAVAEEKGVPSERISGTIQNDILKEYAARGTYIYPPEPSMRLITDVFSFCKERVPKWNTISISGYHIREAGSTAVQEVAFTLANGIAYVKAALDAGLKVGDFAPRLSFFFNAHNHFFEEIAKFRAARRLWARLMRERFKADDESCKLRFHTQTGGCTLTAQQVDNNVVRVAYQAMSAALGGTQSLHTNSRDEALALPTEESARLALRTQQVLAYETGVADTVDPLAGSYYVESLTDEIEKRARELIEKIDAMGGAVRAIEQGYVQKEIQNSSFAYQRAVEDKGVVIVGVNEFSVKETSKPDLLKVDAAIEKRQAERLSSFKTSRDVCVVTRSLDGLKNAARGTDNLMPKILSAVKSLATLGEIAGALREVFGEYRENVVV
jgi:methylmalonyl-CoA mutase N-terminal domain/subunit